METRQFSSGNLLSFSPTTGYVKSGSGMLGELSKLKLFNRLTPGIEAKNRLLNCMKQTDLMG